MRKNNIKRGRIKLQRQNPPIILRWFIRRHRIPAANFFLHMLTHRKRRSQRKQLFIIRIRPDWDR